MLLCRSVALHACERMHGNRKGHAATHGLLAVPWRQKRR